MSLTLWRWCYLIVVTCSLTYYDSIVVGADTTEESDKTERGFFELIFSPCKCKCGLPNREARLLGGEYLRGYEFPWLGMIQIREKHTITATLINNKYVLTAATKLIGFTPYDIKVTLGQFDRCFPDVSSTNFSASKIIVHPDFSPGNRAHDLALVRLSAPVTFERRISPICLSYPKKKYLGQVATLVGWSEGQTPEGSVTSSCRPRKLGLPILGYAECVATAADPLFVSVDKGCVGVVGAPSVVCKEDAGGPVMYRSHGGIYELIGILTDKNECTGKPGTAMYANINEHLSWITANTKDACYCFKT